ncbi:cytokine receptor common subunit gamma-like isoform X2 [Limanda limanda]|uniref:cytokine receptor common subunit gamma-like isoform X2 n=1 Tax=Limanda limanda TaxID=27771 RepID=UPI0029C8F8A0|nr:cytokine receptor common subunit gamma-like isoform X2 [Limanda limanda]
MPTRLLLLLFLSGHVFSKEPPDVDCWVIHLKHINCSWNKQGTPDANYTFNSWFQSDKKNCTTYVSENNMNTGCIQPYDDLLNSRFLEFNTRLSHGNETFVKTHHLKQKVLLYAPINLTVKNGSDYNLWFYWNQTASHCVASEVRFRVNDKSWETFLVSTGTQNYCINLPSSSSRYELQVKSRVGKDYGESLNWSSWSEPAVWGSNNSTDTNVSVSAWTPLLYVVAAVILILFVMMFLPNERLRIIQLPVVPKPSLLLNDIEDWLQFSKGMKRNLNYNEQACPVREYCHVSESDSSSSDGSTCSVTTDQTNCSVSIAVNNADDLSTSAGPLSSQEEEQQVSV